MSSKKENRGLEQTVLDRIQWLVDQAANLAQFARKAGMKDQTLRKMLKKKSMPQAKSLLQIAQAGNTTVDWLLTGQDNRKSVSGSHFSEEAIDRYEFLGSIESEVKFAMREDLPPENLYENIKVDMEKALKNLEVLKKKKDAKKK